jgi:hypothetical protein
MTTKVEADPMDVFRYGLRAPDTKRQYPRRFQYFSDFIRISKAILYYEQSGIKLEKNSRGLPMVLNWKKIARGLPMGRRASNDRAPTIEEIWRLVAYPDRRIKPIVFTMVPSGIRIGAWDYLRWT